MEVKRKRTIYEVVFKRPLDFILSFIAIIILSPLMLIIAILVKTKLGSPILFAQERPGKNEKIFKMYKFRSMTNEKDENGNLLPDEKRLTKFGKFLRSTSLDELPQLFNILSGKMSIIGPRPQLIKDMWFMTKEQRKRHLVRPGLTGLAQINGRNNLTWQDKLFYDIEYVKKISFINDLKIVFKTILLVLKRKDIEIDSNNTALYLGEDLVKNNLISKKEYLSIIEKMTRKKIIFLVNKDTTITNFRLELVEKMIRTNFNVVVCTPFGENTQRIIDLGAECIHVDLNRRSTNPFQDFKLYRQYKKILKKEKPDIVLTYTIKPNIYGGLAAKKLKIPYIANITGLGTAVENEGLLQKFILFLYKLSFKNINTVFFQNQTNMNYFEKHNIALNKHKLIPGSGVNLEKFKYLNYPNSKTINITYLGRIMKDKGFDELLEAISYIGNKYNNVLFHIVGFYEEKEYETKILELEAKGYLKYHGKTNNVIPYIEQSHAIINPSYHEGLSNVLLEAAASGRPVLASKIPGCIETFEEGVTGLGFIAKDTKSLILTIEKFLSLTNDEKKEMGIKGRLKIEKEFDRNIVINAYLDQINKILKGE